MSALKSFISLSVASSALVLAACSTVPNNPNYEYSSKYGQPDTDAVQVAQNAPIAAPAQTTDIPATQSQPTLASSRTAPPSASPTEQAYNADQMVGTPGYEMMRAQNQLQSHYPAQPVPLAQPQSVTQQAPRPTGPQEVTYDYAQNTIGYEASPAPLAQTAPQPVPGTAVNVPTGYSYIVQPGDTVYSLSRRLCVAITDVTIPNGIGQDYAISIGQSLTLPNSRC